MVREPKSLYEDTAIPSQYVINKERKQMSRRNEKLYHIYHGMKQRCYNSNNPKYYLYGGKGITICEEWLKEYDVFKLWSFNNGYKENHENDRISIDRIDSSKNYEPSNCRWISVSENSSNANKGFHKFKTKRPGDMCARNIKTGKIYTFTNISKFGRENNISASTICSKINGVSSNNRSKDFEFFRIIKITEGVSTIENNTIKEIL